MAAVRAACPATLTIPARDAVTLAPASADVPVTHDAHHALEDDRYESEGLLGRGGMGAVLLVRDTRIGREVARKELADTHRQDPVARARFAREARLQGQLEHPAIVPVYDVGTTDQGDPFFTMKCVRGESLKDVLEELRSGAPPRFSRRKLLTAFSQLCAAVHYAHDRGVVHRDIKPANVMLGAYGEVYLLDWGVAKVADEGADVAIRELEQSGELDVVQTGCGVIMGSLNTMAPEQAVGGLVDARADVYALGAILFEILTCAPLHPRGAAHDVLAAIVRGVDARASVRFPAADVPPELEALCVAATRLHPSERLASALAMHQAVERYLDGDRDLELRRASARKHAEDARLLADRALAISGRDEEDARAAAVREVGRALALDPDNTEALATLVRVTTTPPRTVPREVAEEIEAQARGDIRIGGVAGAVVYGLVVLAAYPTWRLLGGANLVAYVVAHVLWSLAFVASIVTIRKQSYCALMAMFFSGVGASIYVSTIFSPLLVVPGVVTAHAAVFANATPRRIQNTIITFASLASVGTILAEATGLFADTVRFVNGDIVVHSDVFAWSERSGLAYLALVLTTTVLVPALVVGGLARNMARISDEMMLQS